MTTQTIQPAADNLRARAEVVAANFRGAPNTGNATTDAVHALAVSGVFKDLKVPTALMKTIRRPNGDPDLETIMVLAEWVA